MIPALFIVRVANPARKAQAVGRAESGLAECRVGFRSEIADGHEAVRPIVGVPDDIVAVAAIAGLAAAFLVKIIGSQHPGEGRRATCVREALDFLRKLLGTFAVGEAAEIIRRDARGRVAWRESGSQY